MDWNYIAGCMATIVLAGSIYMLFFNQIEKYIITPVVERLTGKRNK